MNVGLNKIAALNTLLADVSASKCDSVGARKRFEEIEHRSPAYIDFIVVLVMGMTAACLAVDMDLTGSMLEMEDKILQAATG